MNNTTLIFLKLYAMLSMGTCVTALLVFSLPESYPGKRAFVIGLTMYHGTIASLLWQAERFIPISFGSWYESMSITPERTWGGLHGLLGLLFVLWWQVTVPFAQVARQMQMAVQ